MRQLTTVLLLFLGIKCSYSQLSSSGCAGATNYTNGQPNDVVYFFPSGVNGDLTITPEVSGNSFTFVWYRFIPGNNAWALYQTINNAPSSSLNNLTPAAYQVVVMQGNSAIGCYKAWIAQILLEPQVDVQTINPGCNGPINLQGSFTPGQMTAISNLPDAQLLINSDTQISVCFSGVHTWISDLAFYLKGPASCGSPTVLLSPNPGAIGQNAICNNSNNINNLCFSTESFNNLNVCNGMNGLSGTYGSYGPGFTPINWAGLYGCDAMNGGWTVQIYDCIALDVGSLTDATITFNGTDICGNVQSTSYTTPSGFNSPINDNSCSAATASSYVVAPTVPPALLNCTFGYEWTSNPPVQIPNSTTSLNITINNITSPNGTALSWQDIEFTLTATTACADVSTASECWGGNMSDSETYIQQSNTQASITDSDTLCLGGSIVNLQGMPAGGTWSGTGISNPLTGEFNPQLAAVGNHVITYNLNSPCIIPAQSEIVVASEPNYSLPASLSFCTDAAPYIFGQAPFAAIYSGNGITNNSTGTFNAALAGVGNHTITLSAQTVCPADFSTTITVNSLPILSLTGDTTICANTDANLIATGAVNYNWSPAALFSNPISGNTSVNIAANTDIQLTGTDINGCSTTEEYNFTVFDPPYLSVESPGALCQGSLASLSANASEGFLVWLDSMGNYVSNQNPLVSTANSTNTYTAELTDQCNIILTSTGTIIVENEFGISAGSDTLLCEGLNVGISAITIGQPFTTIEWSTASGSISGATNTADALVSAAGVYTVTALSPLGCEYTDDVTVIEFPNPQLTLTADTMICASQPFGLIASGADIYSWSSDAGSFDDASIDNPQITISTSASAAVIGIDLNGCADTATVYLDVFPVLQNSISPVGEICAGDSVTIIATADPGIYQWLDESGNVLGNLTSLTVAPTSTSTYSFNVEDECSSVVTAEIEVEVENGYNINAGMNTGFCPELSVQITAIANGSGASYEWTTNNGVIGTEVNSLSLLVSDAGTYTITQTSPLGCEYSDSIIIVQYPIPPVNAGADNEVCHGIPYPLNASGAINYSWSPSIGLNNNSIANPSVTITNDASYYLTGIDGNGCVGYDTVQLTVRELPQVSIGEVDMICPGSSTLLEATGNYDSFLWAPSSTLNLNNLSIVESTPQTTTQYFVTLTDPECGLTAQASVTVSVESGFSINAGQDISFCEGSSVTTQAIAQGDYDQLQWSSSTGSSFITSNVTDLTTSENGTFIASITSPLGCEYSDAMQVIEITYPQINLPDSIPFCQGEAVNVSVGLGWDAIEWSTGDNSYETSIEYQGLYYVSVYNSFCATHDTFFVYQVQLPWFDLGPNRELCEGDTLTLNAGIDGLWNNGAYGSSIQALQEGTYSFSIEEEGCISFDEVYIDVIELPEYTFISPQYACMDELHTLEPIGAYGAVFEWENGEFGETLTIDAPGNYYVIVSNECGTTAAQVEVVYQDCEGLVFIPNCFTPDGDGINDVWSVSGADILGMDLKIFNRWGEVIFHSQEINPVWTGGDDGGDYYVKDGIYLYEISVVLPKGDIMKMSGSFMMMR